MCISPPHVSDDASAWSIMKPVFLPFEAESAAVNGIGDLIAVETFSLFAFFRFERFGKMPSQSLVLISTILASFALSSCSRTSDAKSFSAPEGQIWLTAGQIRDAKIETDTVRDHSLGDTVVTTGRVSFDDARVSHVFSPVTGKVIKVHAHLGQHVQAGEALATIDSPDLGVASAELNEARADYLAAEHEFQREQELFAAQAGSRRELETAQGKLTRARAEVERALLKGRLLRGSASDLVNQWYVLRAPIDGDVVSRSVAPGMEVQGQYATGAASELFTIGNLDPIWVMSDVCVNDIPRVQVHAPADVRVVSFGDRTFTSQVDYVADVLNPATQTLSVRVVLPNPKHELRPDMFANVAIHTPGTRALTIPRHAIVHYGETQMVFAQLPLAPDGRVRFERRPVLVDEDLPGDLLPVTRGLTSGETIVVAGLDALTNRYQ